MFKRALVIGAAALTSAVLSSTTAFAGQSTQTAESQTVIVQSVQGAAIAVSVPIVSNEAPFALSGQNSSPRISRWVAMQLGQGTTVLVPE